MLVSVRVRGASLALLASSQFLVVLNTSIVNVALPAIGDDLSLSAAGLSWVVNAYLIAFGALLPVGGRIADLYGGRRALSAGLALFTAGSAGAALSSGAGALIAARAVQGVGAAVLSPAALAILLALYPAGAARGRALGVWGSVSAAGGAAGVLLGGLLTEALGWWSVFAVGVPVAAFVLAAVPHLVPGGDAPPRRDRLDVPGTLSVTLGLLGVAYGLGGGGWAAIAAGVALLGLFALWEQRVERQAAAPLIPPSLLRTADVGIGNVLMLLLGMVWVGTFFFLPLYQQRVLGYSPLEAGLTQLPLAVALVLAPLAAGRLRRTLVPGLVTLAAGLAWLARAPEDATFLVDLLGPTVLVGAGLGLAFVPLTALGVAGVPGELSGVASGLVTTTRQVGGALGLAVLTSVAGLAPAGVTGYRRAFLAAAAISLIAATAALLKGRIRWTSPT
ncbi:MFS transporter [Microbispora sp. KK1-11]|uniref:MFS transporter n=1 Tax=Microbispora sp. KK1-11 TaxID=2053005 RepID=UPI00115A7DAF|nr:MFS transporter [Microbispora sp. KK1-11]TQS28019.1 MFS transporter [Microbispora sp. KK1-11]